MSCAPRARAARPSTARSVAPVLALLAGLLTGCSSSEGPEPTESAPSLSEPTDAPTLAVEPVSRLGKVTGRMPRKDARTVEKRVSGVAVRWLTDAYVGGRYPRTGFDHSFSGFSRGARQAARRDLRVMSNADIGRRVEQVTPTRIDIGVDLLAVAKRAVGSTAHVLTTFRTSGKEKGQFRVAGRLHLTKQDGHWTVFAYHVSKGGR